jgi:hypothetical protein
MQWRSEMANNRHEFSKAVEGSFSAIQSTRPHSYHEAPPFRETATDKSWLLDIY